MKYVFLLCLLFALPLVSASISDPIAYYSFDDGNVNEDYRGLFNLTNFGTSNITGKLGSARNFDPTNSTYLRVPFEVMPNTTGTVAFWQKSDDSVRDGMLFEGGTAAQLDRILQNGGSTRWRVGLDAVFQNCLYSVLTCQTSTDWAHIAMVWNGTAWYFYVNATYSGTTNSFSANANEGYDYGMGVSFFNNASQSSLFYDGIIDEVVFYDYALSNTELSTLFNSGNGYNPLPVPNENFTVTVVDSVTGHALNASTVGTRVSGSGDPYDFVYSNSINNILVTNVANNNGSLFDVFVDTNETGFGYGYISRVYSGISVVNNITANLTAIDPPFQVVAQINGTNTSILSFTAVANGSFDESETTTNGTAIFSSVDNPDGLFNITVSSSGYYTRTYTNYNVSQNLTANLFPVPIFRVTAKDADTAVPIVAFTATINGTAYPTTNGTIITDLLVNSGAFDILVSATGYTSRTYTAYNLTTSPLDAELTASGGGGATADPARTEFFIWGFFLLLFIVLGFMGLRSGSVILSAGSFLGVLYLLFEAANNRVLTNLSAYGEFLVLPTVILAFIVFAIVVFSDR